MGDPRVYMLLRAHVGTSPYWGQVGPRGPGNDGNFSSRFLGAGVIASMLVSIGRTSVFQSSFGGVLAYCTR